MRARELIQRLDHDRMVAAIAAAERRTSGEIRVVVSHRRVADARHAAVREFERLGMARTRHRNAVLIFVAPESQNFAILGDEAVHAKCGEAFWERVVAAMTGRFREGRFTEGIVHGIDEAGRLLAEHFPPEAHAGNELPDAVIER